MAASNTTNTLKDGTKKRIRYYSCANFRNKGAKVCHANSIRADVAEGFVADRLKEIIQVPEILGGLVKEINLQMKKASSQYETELSLLQVKATDIEEKLSKWNNLLEDNPEMIVELDGRINELQNQKIINQEEQNQLKRLKDQEGESIKVTDITVLLTAVEGLLKKGTTKEVKQIYQCFIKEITFNKDTKADIQMTVYFNEAIVDQLNKSYQEAISRGDMVLFVLRKKVYLHL